MGPLLKKEELLSGKREIEQLFNQGHSFFENPFRIIWEIKNTPLSDRCKVLFSVPKKRIGKAVSRNTLKRKMREAYRLNKNLIVDVVGSKDEYFVIAFVYVGNELIDFDEIERKIILSLKRLVKEYEKCFA